jgi:hypothetical protein
MANSTDTIGQPFMKRLSIGFEAARHQGAHYLWGAAGDTPGNPDGAAYRQGVVKWEKQEIDNPAKAMVWGCSLNVSPDANEKRVCCGRYQKIDGGREARSKDGDLQHYLATLQTAKNFPQSWPPFNNSFTPRVANWKNDDGVMVTKLVWGEDCRKKRHFDCVHFINYVLFACGVKTARQREISHYVNDLEDCKKNGYAKPWPADIVTRGDPADWHHIGILLDERFVVEAAESVLGVWKHAYEPDKWNWRGRIPDAGL